MEVDAKTRAEARALYMVYSGVMHGHAVYRVYPDRPLGFPIAVFAEWAHAEKFAAMLDADPTWRERDAIQDAEAKACHARGSGWEVDHRDPS